MPDYFKLFVYGTLRSGYSNHERFCAGATAINPGMTFGRLYDLPYGFPAMICPPSTILATGTTDITRDLEIQNSTPRPQISFDQPPHGFTKVFGEVLTFQDPIAAIPAIDRLEGFQLNASSLYDRVLIPVIVRNQWQAVWGYQFARPIQGTFLPDGSW